MIKIELLPPFHRQAAEKRARIEAELGGPQLHKYYKAGPDAYHEYAKVVCERNDSMPREYRELVYEIGDSATVWNNYLRGVSARTLRASIFAARAQRDARYEAHDRKAALDAITLDL